MAAAAQAVRETAGACRRRGRVCDGCVSGMGRVYGDDDAQGGRLVLAMRVYDLTTQGL